MEPADKKSHVFGSRHADRARRVRGIFMTAAAQPLDRRDSIDSAAVAFMLLLTFSWGMNGVAAKLATLGFNPIFLNVARSGIAAAQPGGKVGDISAAIGAVLRGAGFPVNLQFGGHGVGSTMHQDPHVSNDGRPGRGYTLRPGLLLALEPWVMADTADLVTDADGWTLRSRTGCLTAHSEHTVAITADGPEILTLPR